MKRRRKAKKRFLNKKRLTIFGISLVVILIAFILVMGIGGLFGSVVDDSGIVEPVDRETGKINMLIVGVDKSESLADTIMVASYNLDTDTVNILSIPRDTRMYVGNRYQKINASRAISKSGQKKGINGTIEAVTRLTGLPINYYVEFTFNAFRETIDALGGVEFDVPQNMNYEDPYQDLYIHLKKGPQVLDGEKAEQFVRFRRYPMGDIDRVAAQQAFFKALVEQKLNVSIIPRLPELYKSLQSNLRTNVKFSDVTKYIKNLSDLTSENVHMYSLPGSANGTDYNSSYWVADMTALADLIQNTFGYDASKITIHSADGSSKSKDVKKASPSPTVSASPKTTQSPTAVSPSPTASAKATTKPTKTPSASAKPTKNPQVTATPTPTPTQTPKVAPTKTPEPTVKPSAEPTEKPQDTGIKRPAANKSAE